MPEPIYSFAEALRGLLQRSTAQAFEEGWQRGAPEQLGWIALSLAWRRNEARWELALDEVDGLLLRLLDQLPALTAKSDRAAVRVKTFRSAELERLQHATAAALVAQRFGTAGLLTVLEDDGAPLARRYFAFFALAERHPANLWPLFSRYLDPGVHYAFLGAAAEAARFYPDKEAARRLVELFESTRSDLYLRAFLSPRILESLYVLRDPTTLSFLRHMLTAGHTHPDPSYCEVTRALVMVKRMTGVIEPNVKYVDPSAPTVVRSLKDAEEIFREGRTVLHPVAMI